MSDQSNAYRALALVLDYGEHATASREPFETCTEWGDADPPSPRGCYHEWKHSRNTTDDTVGGWATSELTEDEVATWCEACQENNAIAERRATARKRRGTTMRSMTALAKRVREGQ